MRMSNEWKYGEGMERIKGRLSSLMRLTTKLNLDVTSRIELWCATDITAWLKDAFQKPIFNAHVTCTVLDHTKQIVRVLSGSTDDKYGYCSFKWPSDDEGFVKGIFTFIAHFEGDERYAESWSDPKTAAWKKWAEITLEVLPTIVEPHRTVGVNGYLKDARDRSPILLADVDWTAYYRQFPFEGAEVGTGSAKTSIYGSYHSQDQRDYGDLGIYYYRAHFTGDETYHDQYSNWAIAYWKLSTALTIGTSNPWPTPNESFFITGRLTGIDGTLLKNTRLRVHTCHWDSTNWIEIMTPPNHRTLNTNSEGIYQIRLHVPKKDEETGDSLFYPPHDDAIWDPAVYKVTYEGDDKHSGSQNGIAIHPIT